LFFWHTLVMVKNDKEKQQDLFGFDPKEKVYK
jgi:hypothetical protein